MLFANQVLLVLTFSWFAGAGAPKHGTPSGSSRRSSSTALWTICSRCGSLERIGTNTKEKGAR
jgi:hypothetical protein